MKRIAFILTIVSGILFFNLTALAQARFMSPQVSSSIVISQTYSGGGSSASTAAYKPDYKPNFLTSPLLLNP